MSIRQEIEQWDGKSANDIGEVYKNHCHEDGFLSTVIEFVGEHDLQKGATWLLKKHLESSSNASKLEVSGVYRDIENLEHWESKLHMLQSLPFLIIPKKDKKRIENFLRSCLMEQNKFVRAWAYNGFYELAIQYPEYEKEAKQFFEMAMRDEAPSVKSRIRNILKKGF